jgi:hypothetical protein
MFQMNHWVLDRILPKPSAEAITRLNGMALQLYICSSFLFKHDVSNMIRIAYIFIGHMIYDLLYVDTLAMKIHHILCILLFILHYTYLNYAVELTYTDAYYVYRNLVLLESTSPLLNCAWLLHHFQYPNKSFNICVKAAAALYWTVARMIIFPYLVYSDGSFYTRLFAYPFIPLNIIWFHTILKMSIKEISRASVKGPLPVADSSPQSNPAGAA